MSRFPQATSAFGLVRMRRLLAAFGNPQDTVPAIHVAGTNGKGSTAVCCASILAAAGLPTGLFTSPHIEHLSERLQIVRPSGRVCIEASALEALREEVGQVCRRRMPEARMTLFDELVACAYLYFARAGCRAMVIETGLGGALDATNVISAPKVAVITGIGRDHEHLLGRHLPEIAAAKVGIVTSQTTCLLAGHVSDHSEDWPAAASSRAAAEQAAVLQVLQRHCEQLQVPLLLTDEDNVHPDSPAAEGDLTGMTFFLPERSARFRAPLPGVHQVFNTALAIRATTALYSETITDQVIRTGLQQVKWPGRMQMLLQHPPLIFDGAHNPQGMRSAVQTLNQYFARKGLLLLLGFSADKDWQEMIRILLEEARFQIAGIIFTTPDAERGLPADTPAKHLEELYKPRPNRYNISDIAVCSELTAAVRKTRALQRQTGLPAFVCGSLYAAGTVMRVCAAISEEEQHLELERRGTEI